MKPLTEKQYEKALERNGFVAYCYDTKAGLPYYFASEREAEEYGKTHLENYIVMTTDVL